MRDRAEMVLCALFIVILGLYWCGEVRKNDRKLERTSRCADTAVPDGTPVEWRAAWDACWEVTSRE